MFTGLIREIGTLRAIRPRRGVLHLDIAAPAVAGRVAEGDSVAVNGICLTVTGVSRGAFSAEAAAETRRLTTLGSWRPGRRLHLEPALRMGEALDGHLVQGHVDGIGTVRALRTVAGGGRLLTVAFPAHLAEFLAPKGSVAVDGVSLTLDEGPFEESFTTNIIPHTWTATALGELRRGAAVNLEMDAMVKALRAGRGHPLAGGLAADGPARPSAHALTLDRILAAGFGRRNGKGSK